MNQGHIEAGEVVNLKSLKEDMSPDSSYALIKTPDMEVIRMVVPEGRKIDEHSVKGEMSIQCLEGRVKVSLESGSKELTKGTWLYLNRNQSHSISAVTDSVLLVTILFSSKS